VRIQFKQKKPVISLNTDKNMQDRFRRNVKIQDRLDRNGSNKLDRFGRVAYNRNRELSQASFESDGNEGSSGKKKESKNE